jgi:hypothetical protein
MYNYIDFMKTSKDNNHRTGVSTFASPHEPTLKPKLGQGVKFYQSLTPKIGHSIYNK